MRAIKTLVIGGSLLVNFAAVIWSHATILHGKILGNAAIISKSDVEVAICLLALSVIANLILTIALIRRRGLRRTQAAALATTP